MVAVSQGLDLEINAKPAYIHPCPTTLILANIGSAPRFLWVAVIWKAFLSDLVLTGKLCLFQHLLTRTTVIANILGLDQLSKE
jgi:hypothetical protein